MTEKKGEKIFSQLAADEFVGRQVELDELLAFVQTTSSVRGIHLTGAPGAGVSELLRQVADRIFAAQGEIIPVYFALRRADRTARRAATRFLVSFLRQTVAFRRHDARIIKSSADVNELASLAPPTDAVWIDRLIENCSAGDVVTDDVMFVRNCLSAPLRAAAHGVRFCVMIDDIHENSHLGGEVDFLTELGTVLNQSDVPFIIAGRRRFNETFVQSDLQRRQLSAPSFEDAGLLVSTLAAKFGVVTTDQTRDLLAVQFDGNPRLLSFMLASAADAGLTLNSFRDVEKLYADEVFGGRTARYFDSLLATAVPSASQRREFLGLIFDAQSESERVPVAAWRTRVDSRPEDFERAIAALNTAEFLRLTSDMIAPMDDDPVIGDYIEARFRLEVLQQNRALTVGEATADFLKRAPRMMATFYRRRSALGMREMLAAFNCQEVPLALLDYGRFRDELKGATAADVAAALAQDEDRVMLPQIVYTAHTVSFYPQFARVTERERSAVALGFSETSYTDQDETVWIGAEIDSKLEATRELTEFWCDRLEMVALMCNFQNYRLWLIAPEGFTSEALEVLQSRNAFGSSRRQFSLLAGEIGAGVGQRESVGGTSYEMIVPMGDDTELIAAQTVEEIARRHNFPAKSINQIKTALVEACINATEHSHSPDRRIYQTFTIEDDRLNITVTNRGVRLTDARSREVNPSEGRRGWGLRLMRKLMDDVRVERTDDGTRISMTKLIPAN